MQTQAEFEKFCDAVYQAASRAAMAVLIVPAQMADDLGAQGSQIVANRASNGNTVERIFARGV